MIVGRSSSQLERNGWDVASVSAVGWTIESGAELRMATSSVGLASVRVATAAARRRFGKSLSRRDKNAIEAVIADLSKEISVLEGQTSPDVDNEKSYAFAGIALWALSPSSVDQIDESTAANQLRMVVQELQRLSQGSSDPGQLEKIEKLFLSAGQMVSEQLGSAGETVSGLQDVVARR